MRRGSNEIGRVYHGAEFEQFLMVRYFRQEGDCTALVKRWCLITVELEIQGIPGVLIRELYPSSKCSNTGRRVNASFIRSSV